MCESFSGERGGHENLMVKTDTSTLTGGEIAQASVMNENTDGRRNLVDV